MCRMSRGVSLSVKGPDAGECEITERVVFPSLVCTHRSPRLLALPSGARELWQFAREKGPISLIEIYVHLQLQPSTVKIGWYVFYVEKRRSKPQHS